MQVEKSCLKQSKKGECALLNLHEWDFHSRCNRNLAEKTWFLEHLNLLEILNLYYISPAM